MANSQYTITEANFGNDLNTVLINKYTANIVVHYHTSNHIVFTCPAISNKVIRLTNTYFNPSGYMRGSVFLAYFGDAWTSEINLTNEVLFSGYQLVENYVSTDIGRFSSYDLILGDDFLLLQSNGTTRDYLIIIGKLSNGDFIVKGFCESNTNSVNANCKGYLLNATPTLGLELNGIQTIFKTPDLKMAFMDLVFILNGIALINTDGTFAYLNGLKSASTKTYYIGTNFMTTISNLYNSTGSVVLNNSLIALF